MRKTIYFALPALPVAAIAGPLHAGEMQISLEIPRLRVAEYHNPYVAVWVEDESGNGYTGTVSNAQWSSESDCDL